MAAEAFIGMHEQRRIAFHLIARGEQDDARVAPVCKRTPRHDEAISAVVSFTTNDGDTPGAKLAKNGLPGVVHQDGAGNADVFDATPISLAHLRDAQRPHPFLTRTRYVSTTSA